MPSAKFIQPDSTTQDAATYKNALESAALIHNAVAGAFNVRAADTPAMSVVIASGNVWTGATIIEKTDQTISGIPAPSANQRIDIIEIDPLTGTAYRVAGAEAASPTKPAVTTGRVPLAYFQLATTTTAITNSMIIPVRSINVGAVMRNGSQLMSGPLAVGGTSRAWETGAKVVDLGDGSSFIEYASGGGCSIASNLRFSGAAWYYIENGFGSVTTWSKSAGQITEYTAPSGTAGAVATVSIRRKLLVDGSMTLNGNAVWNAGSLIAGPDGSGANPAFSFSSNAAAGIYMFTGGAPTLAIQNGAPAVSTSSEFFFGQAVNLNMASSQGEGNEVLSISGKNGATVKTLSVRLCSNFAWNGAATAVAIGKNTATNRSISTAGTVNASGADYAEYERKSPSCGIISKGGVVGFDADGLIVDRWVNAVTFGVKSTDPSYVGGDVWGAPDALGIEMPSQPQPHDLSVTEPIEPDYEAMLAQIPPQPDSDDETVLAAHRAEVEQIHAKVEAARLRHKDAMTSYQIEAAAEYQSRMDQYLTGMAAVEEALEVARKQVDRVAYSGKVPVNISGPASVGDFIVPVDDGHGGIAGIAVPDAAITFDQYKRAVGQVKRIMPDGRPEIVVKKG